MKTRVVQLILVLWLATNPAHGGHVEFASQQCTATGLGSEHGHRAPDVSGLEDWVNAVRGGIMKPAPSPCSALFSAATAEYSAHEDEHILQLSRFRAFVLALAEAQEQLVWSSSPVRGPGSTGVLVSARDNGKSENTVTVVLAASDKIRELAGRALGAVARTEDADFEYTRLINEWEAAGLIPVGVSLFWDRDSGRVTIAGFGSAVVPVPAHSPRAQQLRKVAEDKARLRAKSELATFLSGDLVHGGGSIVETGFRTMVSRGFVPAGVRTRLISGPDSEWVNAVSIFSAELPNRADLCGGSGH